MDNISQQLDENEVLKSIFGDEWEVDADTGTYGIQIERDVKLFITLNPDYPSHAPPKYDLLAPGLNIVQKDMVRSEFENIFKDGCGSPIIFQWIEKLREIVLETAMESICPTNENNLKHCITATNLSINEFLLKVTHGPTIIDRKSVFQGHVCKVEEEKDVKDFMNHLLENKKIAQATHNIMAYRILLPNSVVLQDCDDDGEAHAASRILHLLQILKLTNIVVVVTRWYGGIHLGPDRFKHINNAARQALVAGGLIKT